MGDALDHRIRSGRPGEADALRDLVQRGCGEIRLYTHATMVENIRMYARLRYEKTERGKRADYHRLFMRKALK